MAPHTARRHRRRAKAALHNPNAVRPHNHIGGRAGSIKFKQRKIGSPRSAVKASSQSGKASRTAAPEEPKGGTPFWWSIKTSMRDD